MIFDPVFVETTVSALKAKISKTFHKTWSEKIQKKPDVFGSVLFILKKCLEETSNTKSENLKCAVSKK